MEDRLFDAVRRGATGEVEVLLAEGANVNATNKSAKTPLHEAVWRGHKDIVAVLLVNGADVNAKDGFEWTPLFCAAWYGEKDIIAVLLANGADMDARDSQGWRALHAAAERGYREDSVGALLDNEEVVAEIVAALLAKGADVNAKDSFGMTPLHFAECRNHSDVAGLLRDAQNESLVQKSAADGAEDLAKAERESLLKAKIIGIRKNTARFERPPEFGRSRG